MCKGRSRQTRAQTLVNTKWEEPCSAGVATGRNLHRPRDGRRTSTWKSCPSDERWIEAPGTAAYAAVTLRPAQAPGGAITWKRPCPRGGSSSCGALFDLLSSPAGVQ